MFLTCSSNFELLQNVTPSSLADTTRSIPVKHDGKDERADDLQKIVSLVAKDWHAKQNKQNKLSKMT